MMFELFVWFIFLSFLFLVFCGLTYKGVPFHGSKFNSTPLYAEPNSVKLPASGCTLELILYLIFVSNRARELIAGQLRVQLEQVSDDCFFVAIELDAISLFNCGVKGGVGAGEAGVEKCVVGVV